MKALLRKNKYLSSINRLRHGQKPVFIEYDIDFTPRWTGDKTGNPHLAKIILKNKKTFQANLERLSAYEDVVKDIQKGKFKFDIDWHNVMMPALDALTLMDAAVNATSTYMEIGSGNSTRFVKAALKTRKSKTKIISIDPCPRADIDTLCDKVIRSGVETVDLSMFDTLKKGDVLFIDNSHRSFMNSDVTVCMLDILPRLKKGVLVGIHDIFLPFDYFDTWSERGYNEQYLLASYLLANPDYFDMQFSNYWICQQKLHEKPLQNIWDILGDKVKNRPSSAFWGIKT